MENIEVTGGEDNPSQIQLDSNALTESIGSMELMDKLRRYADLFSGQRRSKHHGARVLRASSRIRRRKAKRRG